VKWRKSSLARWRCGGPGVLAGLTLVAVLSAACSSPSPSRSIASLSNGSTTTTRPALTPAEQSAKSDQEMVDYARCLRSHGINEPDPVKVAGHPGLSMQVPTRTPSNGTAIDACDHLLGPQLTGNGGAAAPAISATRLSALTKYAQCMRAHDISMLDPDQYGNIGLGKVAGIDKGFGRNSPQFRSADTACRYLLPAGTHDVGNGP